MAHILHKWTVATVQVVYYIPDYLHIVNEFVWQTEDQIPEFPRITKFLNYWDKNIDGPIKEVYIYDQGQSEVRVVDRKFKLNWLDYYVKTDIIEYEQWELNLVVFEQ